MGSHLTGVAGGASKFFEGKKMQRRADKFIEDFKFSELNNVQEDRQVSTRGSDLMNEQANLMASTSVDALRSGGTRSIVGGLGRVEANRNQVSRETGANLDMQEKEIQAATAADNANLRAMRENRETNELSGYGQMLNVGMGMKYQGITDVYNAQAATEDRIIKIAGMAMGGGAGGGAGGAGGGS
jgi:hypothetical protein